MAEAKSMVKPMSDSYLFSKTDASKKMYGFVVSAERLDINSPEMEDIKYMIKRNQYTSVLVRLVENPNVILVRSDRPMPRAFKTFAFTDVKESSQSQQIKIFIDVSEIVRKEGSMYTIRSTDFIKMVAYLVSALGIIIYYGKPTALLNNNAMLNNGTEAYAKLFTNIIDYLRIGATDKIREKTLYMSSLYYQINVLKKDTTDSVLTRAEKISGLTKRECDVIYSMMDTHCFDDINCFIKTVADVLNTRELNTDNFVDKWTFLYGVSTQFAPEIYTAFNTMLTNAYVGAYLNNQKTIEKIVNREMVEYTKALFKIGDETLK